MILLHISAWIILLGIPVYFMIRWDVGLDFMWLYYINVLINGVIFYVNYLFLIPRFFFGIKTYRYYLSALILIAAFYFVSDFSNKLIYQYYFNQEQSARDNRQQSDNESDRHLDENEMNRQFTGDITAQKDSGTVQERQFSGRGTGQPSDDSMPARQLTENTPDRNINSRPPRSFFSFRRTPFRRIHLFNYAFSAFFITFFALGLRVLLRHSLIEKRQKELEKEKLNSELAFLKNQISPHFFFNTLNNIYSLISINTEDSQKAVLQLSRMMRYLLYESEHGEIKLSSEIEFMNNYIDLMRLRMSDKVSLDIQFPSEVDNIIVPPLLFIPLIENAFKHGVSYREKSFIKIIMDVSKEFITFSCSNSKVQITEESMQEHSGIGLDNLKKRLNLIFPGKHEIHIDSKESVFEVNVKIFLK